MPVSRKPTRKFGDHRLDEFRSSFHEPVHFFPNVVREAEAMIFLYEGDACYESGDLTLQGPIHRTVGKGGVFYYEPLSGEPSSIK
ncbi:MAG: hypothetical protein VYB84_02800 [Pseudomonadota bacterium]|nr:hypothetical protein [Pseudomonadota bacterium]